MPARTPTEPDRYEPLPGVAALPGWIWRKLGGRIKLLAAIALLAVVGAGAALIPAILESKEQRAETERRERAQRRAELISTLRAEQRPRFRRSGSVAPAGAAPARQLASRTELMDELSAAILADA